MYEIEFRGVYGPPEIASAGEGCKVSSHNHGRL
jgi:hypothetical protein